MRDLNVLIVANNIAYPTQDDLDKNAAWYLKHQGITVTYDVVKTHLHPLKFKDFGVLIGKGDFAGATKTSWGLKDIKQQLRDLNIVPYAQYHAVVFMYELYPNWDWANKPLGAWTYPDDINGCVFIEMPSTLFYEQVDGLYRVLNHELLHAEHRICWWRGTPTYDSMDLYDKELDVDAPDGNRARNLKTLAPYIDLITIPPRGKLMLALLGLYQQMLKFLTATNPMKNINLWADGIQEYEGYIPPGPKAVAGSRSYRNRNPGNLRYTGYTASLGATGKDDKNFCIFPTYKAGYDALCQFLKDAADNQLLPYKAKAKQLGLTSARELSLVNFFEVYAPSNDNNEPNAYALYVARKIGVNPTAKIGTML